jgi:1,4-alpha-glucan branching enzyme
MLSEGQLVAKRKWMAKNREKILAYRRKYYEENKEKVLGINTRWNERNPEKVREIQHAYYQSHKEKINQDAREWEKKHPEKILASKRKWIENNPAARKAHLAVREALRTGKLKKQSCSCGSLKSHAHHDDYDKPLEVIWLCPQCHKTLHKELKKKL